MTKQDMLSLLNFRHACKRFDETKKIDEAEFDLLLEVARLSPSSFGMEPWRLIVVRNSVIREKIQKVCWNQPQITTCSELVIFCVDIDAVEPYSEYVRNMFERRQMSQEMQEAYNSKYSDYHEKLLDSARLSLGKCDNVSKREKYHWCAKQCYIAAANMMSFAAMRGIDSCPIEGFEKENLEKILELDTTARQVVLVLPFGYRINEQPPKYRLDLKQIVEFK